MNTDYKNIENKLVEFLQKETGRIGIKKAVVGLSGGIDSAVTAFLSAKALGKENVLGIMMPYKTSSKESITDAQKVVDSLGIKRKKVEITEMVDAYLAKLKDDDITAVRKGNIMARMRMIVLYDHSAKEKALVIGTGNKTECLLGYTTLFGDSACAINPVGDIYKTQIFGLAKYMGVPETIQTKKPSADLWTGQTDEEEMGLTYAEVDKYLFAKVNEKKSVDDLLAMGYKKDYIEKVDALIEKNKFKSLPAVVAKLF
jgi:NAD+ synthase